MVGGVSIVGIVGFVYIIALLFSVSDVDSVLAAPVPVIKIFTVSPPLHYVSHLLLQGSGL